MIYSTNRTASLGEMTVDVNESYFGAGMLNFMQENAQDELALFEAAIKSDIDEAIIGESSSELEALNENFVTSAAKKIREMMEKFIAWLQSVMRSAVAKLTQLLVRDNAKFVKAAQKRISTMKNSKKFKYTGKALNFSKLSAVDISEAPKLPPEVETLKGLIDKAETSDPETIKNEVEKAVKDFKDKDVRKGFNDSVLDVKESDNEGLEIVQKHLDHLKQLDKKNLASTKKTMNTMVADAKKIAKDADKAARNVKDDDDKKSKLDAKAKAAAAYRDCCQTHVKDTLYLISQQAKICRAVVTKAMGATPKNEGAEYSEELIQAMIEASDFEYDEALEEMSEAKDCCDDDLEDDDDEE